MAPNYWQVEDNASWKTDVIHKCDVCGKKSRTVINIREDNLGINSFICFLQDRPCFYDFISKTFGINPDLEYVMARVIEYHKDQTKREPTGLSLRYKVMKRDGFKCVLCGKTKKESILEIDHIIPVSKGGGNNLKNLQTLCFDCNRGKRDHD